MGTEARILNLLGLAAKAGRVASGGYAVRQAIEKGQAKLLIIAKDGAAETVADFRRLAAKYVVKTVAILTKEQLGKSLGKEQRAAVAVLDAGFSEALVKLMGVER